MNNAQCVSAGCQFGAIQAKNGGGHRLQVDEKGKQPGRDPPTPISYTGSGLGLYF